MARGATIIGLTKLQRKLDKLPKVAKDVIRQKMEEAAEEVVAMMKRLAPLLKEPDPRRRRGALRDSIGWTWGKKPRYAVALAQVKASMAGDLTITIYAGNNEVRYAHLIEWGTMKMKAQPFFFVSWRASRKSAKRKMRAGLREAVKAVAAGK